MVQKSGIIPWILISGIRTSASQTIAISITKPNKLKVKIRKGKERILRMGAMDKFNNAIANPASARMFQLPVYDTPGMIWAAKKSAPPLPIVYMINFNNICQQYINTTLWAYFIKSRCFGNENHRFDKLFSKL